MHTRGVIEKGAIWRVGDSQKIDMWQHRWFPDLTYNKICSPRADLRVERLCDLCHTNTRTLDPDKLESYFLPWEAEMVSRIQVSDVWGEDRLIWPSQWMESTMCETHTVS